MKTAVTGEDDQGHIAYNRSLLALAQHYRFQPRACRPYRAKTKGKVERPFSYIRQDFFLGRSFRNLDDLNAQLIAWLDTVANVRVHGTTQRAVAEAFAAEQPELQTLPQHRFDAVLKLERRVSHDGFVAIGGNYYSVPDRTRRVVEVQGKWHVAIPDCPSQRLGEHACVVLQIGRFKAGQIVDLADVRRGIIEDDRYGARHVHS